MSIRAGGEVSRLVADLRGADATRRDTAIARLRVAGARAVDALAALAASGEPAATRGAALRALEGIDDPRAIDAALAALADPAAAVLLPAIAVLRHWLTREAGTRALDALTSLSLDPAHDATVRIAALDSLAALPRHLLAPLVERAGIGTPAAADGEDPLALQEWLAAHGEAPLSDLHALIVRVRDREQQEPSAVRRQQWARVRGTAHAALARRGSKVALYDLREAFDAAQEPLPLDFLSAVTAIGDATCLEPMARAWAANPQEGWWRERLADAAADIMHRTRLSGRSAVVKRIRVKWAGFL